jgi:uroporphyrinogen-III synthase
MTTSMAGLTVVNTRPAHQAGPLSEAITLAGGNVIEFPVIEIQPIVGNPDYSRWNSALEQGELAIFISANAVDAGLNAIGGAENWPSHVAIAAVGRATAEYIQSCGLTVDLVAPEPFNSEALLTVPELHEIQNKKIVIFRGEGGRELLAQTLRDRGAEVVYAECYRRVKPDSDPSLLYRCWDQRHRLIFVVTSNEGLQNLVEMVDNEHQPLLLSSTVLVVSERASHLAKELGFKTPAVVTKSVSISAIVDAILLWFNK